MAPGTTALWAVRTVMAVTSSVAGPGLTLNVPATQFLVPSVLVVAVTVVLLLLADVVSLPYVAICYLIPVAISASHWGGWSALTAAALAAMAMAYFFYPPIYSLQVDNPQQMLDLALFAIVGCVLGYLVIGIRANARAARLRAAEIDALHHFSRRLAVSSNSGDIYAAIQDHVSALTGRPAWVVEAGSQRMATIPAGATLPAAVGARMHAIAAQNHSGDDRYELIADWMIRPLRVKGRLLGVAAVELRGDDEPTRNSTIRRVDGALDEAVATLERIDVGEAISEARLRRRAETLRQALIGSVSHELCTPLASILGAASILVEARPVTENPQLGPLATVIRDEAERLHTDIQTLLHASRISSESVTPHLAWTDVTDIVNAAIDRRRNRLAGHELIVDLPADLPLVMVDSLLIEQALGQILDNARKYAPAGTTIRVAARVTAGCVAVEVTDRGIGLTTEEISQIWERFYRSPRASGAVAGSGLGLWVARALAEAGGAGLAVSSPGADLGATFTILIPVAEAAAADAGGGGDDEADRPDR